VTVKLPAAANLMVQKHFPVERKANYGFEDVVLNDIEINDSLPNILVVEDHKGLNKHISQTLGEKFNVSFALNGHEALKKIKVKVPDLIISDVMMDVMDGFEMAKTLSVDAALSHIPIIFLSARSTQADKIQGLNLGAVDYIEKPFATEELQAKVESFLVNKEKGHQVLYNFTYERMKREEQHKSLTSEIEQIGANSFDQNCEHFLLTAREKEIARFVMEGLTAKAIAVKISRSENTVKNHISSIYEKVSVNNKIELIKRLNS
jgi:two-component system sensor histidine kinase ChiS